MRPSVPVLALLVLLSAAPALAADAPLGDTIRRTIDAQGPMITPAEHAMIRAKCGLPAGTAPVRNLNMTNGALQCPDGRQVRDAETVAMSDRIGKRASAYAQKALNRPEVKAAISHYADEQTAATLRRLRKEGVLRD